MVIGQCLQLTRDYYSTAGNYPSKGTLLIIVLHVAVQI